MRRNASGKMNGKGRSTSSLNQNRDSGIPRHAGHKSSHRSSENIIKHHRHFDTNYCRTIKLNPPPVPPSLLKISSPEESNAKKKESAVVGPGRVKVMLRVCPQSIELPPQKRNSSSRNILKVVEKKKTVEIHDPSSDLNSAHRRMGVSAPKMYSFDAVFPEDTAQSDVSQACLPDVIQSVVQGADGAIFCYGQSRLGKTYTLLGDHGKCETLGVAPCAISWLFKAVRELNQKQNCKYSIRVSALELFGRTEHLKDLLVDYAKDGGAGPLCIEDDPLFGTQIQNQTELRASSVEKAAFLLDAAIAARSTSRANTAEELRRHSHFVFTLHVYQYKGHKSGPSLGKSRLHLIDLGSCERTLVKTQTSLVLSLNSLGHAIMGIINNSKHVPFKESKLTSVLRQVLGNLNCRAVMIAHVSKNAHNYSDTLSTIQMASRIHRVLMKRKTKGNVSNGSILSYELSRHLSAVDRSLGTSSSVDGTSGSELSCDTVIYVRPNGSAISDMELTDNEGPPVSVPIQKPKLQEICESPQQDEKRFPAVTSGHKNRTFDQPHSKKERGSSRTHSTDTSKSASAWSEDVLLRRQEPDGCDSVKSRPLSKQKLNFTKYIEELENALSALDQTDVCISHQTTYADEPPTRSPKRPDSLVTPTKTKIPSAGKQNCVDDSDDSEVEVNFYCLSVTTNKHGLVPLSRTAVSKQVQNCLQKSNSKETISPQHPPLKRSDTFIIESSNSIGERCHVASEDAHSQGNSSVSSPSQLIVYDSSSLEINYVKPKSKSFPKQTKIARPSITSVNVGRKKTLTTEPTAKCCKKFTKSKGVKSKSASEVSSPKLSLVKMNGRDSPLELVITERKKSSITRPRSSMSHRSTTNITKETCRPSSAPKEAKSTKSSKSKLPWVGGFKRLGSGRKTSESSEVTNDICFSRCATEITRPVQSNILRRNVPNTASWNEAAKQSTSQSRKGKTTPMSYRSNHRNDVHTGKQIRKKFGFR